MMMMMMSTDCYGEDEDGSYDKWWLKKGRHVLQVILLKEVYFQKYRIF